MIPSDALHSNDADPHRLLRQITILFVDVVGSTALSQEVDPEDLQSIIDGALREFTSIVQSHGGRVLQYAGDNLLAAFGADVSVEDDPEQAVRAALQIVASADRTSALVAQQFGPKGFHVRAGLDTGNVLLGGGVNGAQTVRGVAVNMAARMEQSAPVGRIRISQNTFLHVRRSFDLQEEAPLVVKGFEKPLRSYLVNAALSASALFQERGTAEVTTPLVGRSEEFESIKSAFRSMLENRRWLGLTLAGEPGIGKSRLLFEFDDWLSRLAEPVCRMKGRCDRRQAGGPYALLRDILVRHFAILDTEPLTSALEKLVRGFGEVLLERSEEHATYVGHLIGLDCSLSPFVVALGGDGALLRSRASLGLVQYVQAHHRSENRPLVLTLEDLQWADQGSLDLISELSVACSILPVMLLCTTRLRAHERPAFDAADPVLELSALTEASSRALVSAVLGLPGEPPPLLADLVSRKAQGNPYFIAEFLHMMVDEGVIATDGTDWKLQDAQLKKFPIPTTLTGLLQARLDALTAPERSLLQKASVIGFVFWDEPLRRVALSVSELLEALARRDLVSPREASSVANAREHEFKHHVLHQVIYGGVLKEDKRQLHRLTAEWILEHSRGRENEFRPLIAGHFEQAGDDALAAIHLRQAAVDASNRFALEESIGLSDRALRLIPATHLTERYELLKTRARCLSLLARLDEELADIHEIEKLAEALGENAKRAEALTLRARYALFLGDDINAGAMASRAAALGRSCGDVSIELMAMSIGASASMHVHDYIATEAIATRMLQRAEAAGEYRRHIDALHLLGTVALAAGQYVASRAHYHQALDLARAHDDPLLEAIQLHNLGDVERRLGNLDIARGRLEEGLRVCSRVGSQKIHVHLLGQLAQVEVDTGSPQVAIDVIAQAMALSPALRNSGINGELLSIRGKAQAALRQTSEAICSYTESRHIYEQAGLVGDATEPMAGLARLFLMLDQIGEATSLAEEIEGRLAAVVDIDQVADRILACSEVFAASGQTSRAAVLSNRARNLFQTQPTPARSR